MFSRNDELKIAKVIAIYKSGSADDFSNYHPLSVIPAISKSFERLAHNRLSAFTRRNVVHCILGSMALGKITLQIWLP